MNTRIIRAILTLSGIIFLLGNQLITIGELPTPQSLNTIEQENSGNTCQHLSLSFPGESTMPVPSACITGLCKIVVFVDAVLGDFSEGYSWPVYYTQDPNTGIWVGGANISIGGVSFSSGEGVNGDQNAQAIYYGGQSISGDFVSIFDDGELEQSPEQWTIKAQQNGKMGEAIIQVCALDHDQHTITTAGYSTMDVPNYCIENLCGILLWTDAPMGDFGPGFLWPVYYRQDSLGSWIGGPNVNFAGVQFSTGSGTNGDFFSTSILYGADTTTGDYIRLYDDRFFGEFTDDQWTIYFNPGSEMTQAAYYTFPMTCDQKEITTTGESTLTVPPYCVDSICSILHRNNATMGAFFPGLNWPAHYQQSSTSGSWKGGPAVSLDGFTFSHGQGANGNPSISGIYVGGLTSTGDYIKLMDDGSVEHSDLLWTVDYHPGAELSQAAYYICIDDCQETRISLPTQYLPITLGK